jgi:hypothetical protein
MTASEIRRAGSSTTHETEQSEQLPA